MCDAFVALPSSTANGVTLFAKNSDRQRNEAQIVELMPAKAHQENDTVECTYLTLPQVSQTNTVLICRPFWSWGAEMGGNEFGVAVGNEGLFARVPSPEEPALTGMDLVRLTLERAKSAAESVEVITDLLERHGQGGNCGHLTPAYYHNSFMIADPSEAFVVETVGREWLVERITKRQAISNMYCIGSNAASKSRGLSALVRRLHCDPSDASNYSKIIGETGDTHIGSATQRRKKALALLESFGAELSVANAMAMLRDHQPLDDREKNWNPRTSTGKSLCIHAGAVNRAGQTTGAMVSDLRPRASVHWVTGTAAPCISIFKPVMVDVPLPAHGSQSSGTFDPESLWWKHERIHRKALASDYPVFLREIGEERDALEARFHAMIESVRDANPEQRQRIIAQCWEQACNLEARWETMLSASLPFDDSEYGSTWAKMNDLAELEN
jgi:secernin